MGKNTCQPSDNTKIHRTIKMKKYRYKKEKRGGGAGKRTDKKNIECWRQGARKANITVPQAVDAPKDQVRELLSKKNPITLDAYAKTNKQKQRTKPKPEYLRSLFARGKHRTKFMQLGLTCDPMKKCQNFCSRN